MPRQNKQATPEVASVTWKEPAQERSRQRFQAILDAAGALLDEGGMDLFTMDNIARRADTSMGSLYHFFPDREALLMALTTSINRELYSQMNELSKPANVQAEPEVAISFVFPALLDMIKRRPGTRSIITLAHSVPAIEEARKPFVAAFSEMAEIYMMFKYPELPADRRKVAVAIFHHLSESLIVLVSACAERQRKQYIRESEAAMAAYLRTLASD